MNRNAAVTSLVLEALLAAYFGVGAFLFLRHYAEPTPVCPPEEFVKLPDGSFGCAEAAKMWLAEQRLASAFPMHHNLDDESLLFIACCAFGMLGGVMTILLRIANGKLKVEKAKVFSIPLLGLLSGFAVMLVIQFLPNSLMEASTKGSGALCAVALLAGLFFSAFYAYLSKFIPSTK